MNRREIKFRVWDVIGKRMIPFEEAVGTGVDISTPDGRNYQMPLFSVAFVDGKHKLIALQYIGQKDAYGKEIYEGDIVENVNFIGIVEYNSNFSSFTLTEIKSKIPAVSSKFSNFSERVFGAPLYDKVLGNIFENENLLTEFEFTETPTNIIKEAHEEYLKSLPTHPLNGGLSDVIDEDEEEMEKDLDLDNCENCGESAWDGRICHICGAKNI